MKIIPRVTVNVIISAMRLHSAETLSDNLWHLRHGAVPSGRWGLIARYGDVRWGSSSKLMSGETEDSTPETKRWLAGSLCPNYLG